ncbi:Ty1/Copia family ribonuclease HI [bacterium]|nr:Ty1/Copia family ribonuclease HI [bacterium]
MPLILHGDDALFTGPDAALKKVQEGFARRYDIKTQRLGANHSSEIKILNRILRRTDQGIEVEADPRHVNELIKGLDVEGTRGVSTPLPSESDAVGTEQVVCDEEEVDQIDADLVRDNAADTRAVCSAPPKDGTLFRAMAARLNYLSQDRADLRHASKVIARGMAKPDELDWVRLRHVAKNLQKQRRAVVLFRWRGSCDRITAYSDSDWAGDRRDRRSTSGGTIMMGAHCIKHWSKIQGTIALSTAEAEIIAGVRAATEAIGLKALAADLGIHLQDIDVRLDATAALAIIQREGLSSTRHIDVKWFWIQEAVRSKKIRVSKVHTDENPADAMTKRLKVETLVYLLRKVGFRFLEPKPLA